MRSFQNHLQILQHEGAHYHLHPNKKINDLLSDLFCSIPFGGLIRHYRYFHFLHHKHLLNPDLDPEVNFYEEQGYKLSIKDLIGINYLQFMFSYNRYLWKNRKSSAMPIGSIAEYLAIAIVMTIFCTISIKVLAVYWLVPQVTLLFFYMKIHGLGEHSPRTNAIETCTYNRKINFIEKFFISPLNSHLHLEHHKKPGIPWNLVKI